MAWVEADVLAVVRVALRKRKQAIDATDTLWQARIEESLDDLDPDWLTTVWADWAAAGYPVIL